MRHGRLVGCAILLLLPVTSFSQDSTADIEKIPAIKSFIGEGLGSKNPGAPAETQQFGRLIGLWDLEVEMRAQTGVWVRSAPGIWVWKYALNGFAVRDLFYQGAKNLPMYMASLGRDYLLSANRIYDVDAKKWQVAWMANGAGQVMGDDFGTFTAVVENDEIVMTSPPGNGSFGLQRVIFYEISNDSFKWKSEYSSNNGTTWNAVMRMHAKRRARP